MQLKIVTYITILHPKKKNLDYALRNKNNVSETKMKQMITPNLVLAPKELQLTRLH